MKEGLFSTNDPIHKGRRRKLRRRQTKAEFVLWQELRNRRFLGLKWMRQFGIDRYIADFCCVELKLVIEVDGFVHKYQKKYDQARTEHLESYGYGVVRFSNKQVLFDRETVLEEIKKACIERRGFHTSPPSPLLRGEGGSL